MSITLFKSPIIHFLALALVTATAQSAAATVVTNIPGTHSRGEIKTACANVGGYYDHGAGKGYGCTRKDGASTVECDATSHCKGYQWRLRPPTIRQALHGSVGTLIRGASRSRPAL
jgi:hypothetical protein